MNQPTIQPSVPQVTPQPSSWNGYIIAIIICIVIGVLYYFISPHYQTILDYVEVMKSFSEMLFTFSKAMISQEKEPEQKIINTEQKIKNVSNEPKAKSTPKPDDSSSIIQGTGTAGYCYVGEWKGIRSCVKVDKTTPCKTQVYSTEEICVNPTLRP